MFCSKHSGKLIYFFTNHAYLIQRPKKLQILHLRYCLASLLLVVILLASCQQTDSTVKLDELPDRVDYNYHVKPILSDRCYACHGPDDNTVEADLRLHVEDLAMKATAANGIKIIDPGSSSNSELIKRIKSKTPDYMMPPPDSELEISDYEIEILAKWIEQGAEWKKHWSFIPPSESLLPKVSNEDWCNNPIDYFILERLEQEGLNPAQESSKEAWLRKVSFDITGLPPKIEEIQQFIDDESETSYEQVVDKLLSSLAYGERMASNWLDVARYADSHGYQDDRPRTSWPWRDWVINAFNDNLPYDQFATWQLAGDLLPDATYEQKLATGFNRNHPITQEGGVVQEEYLTEYAADRTHTFSTAFLGLTVECARCHNHKYDPISQKEYYSVMSFFNSIPERGQISYFDEAPTPNMKMVSPELEAHIASVREEIEVLEEQQEKLKGSEVEEFKTWLQNLPSKEEIAKNLKNGLLADYDLNEENGDYQTKVAGQPESRMNINLPPKIGLPTPVNGKEGKALKFDGANHLSIGDVGDFEWYDDFSYGAWVKFDKPHKEKNLGILARRVGEQKQQGYDLILKPNRKVGTRLIHQYTPHWDVPINQAIDVETKGRINANKWTHLTVTYDGSGKAAGLNIYINGEAQQLNIIMDSLRNQTILTGNDFLVGNWNHRARETGDILGFQGGAVDNPFVYERELSPLEVKEIAKSKNNASKAEKYKHYLANANDDYRRLSTELSMLRRVDQEIPEVMIMQELDTSKATFVLDRGAYDAPTDSVGRTTIAAVLDFPEQYERNRLGLAKWLFDDKNPLTARVMVNRYWQMFFGKGLVATPEDFGNQGALPTHPELLDWLALDFKNSGWDMKAIIKKMVLSSTYRQDASLNEKLLERDKENVLLARGPSQKLTAEMLRDQVLAVSGLLYEKVGGKWVKPYQPKGVWKELANQIGENKYRESIGKDLYRRSIYGYFKRTIPPPSMLTLDASERAVCTVKRQQTSTPLQSLVLLNDPQILEASRVLAEDLLKAGLNKQDCIEKAFYKITSREVKSSELKLLTDIYNTEQSRFEENEEDAGALLSVGYSNFDEELDASNAAALTVVVNAILNLDEAKYK